MKNKKQNKKRVLMFGMILIVGIFMISFISAVYSTSSVRYTQPGMGSFRYLQGEGIDVYPILDREQCGLGQDFIIQVAPQGCTRSVVRSDLLEEQNVPVFCPLMATKVNPLIDVEAINYISFKGQYPEGVNAVGFHPAQAALQNSYKTILNSPVLENIGYAVVVLKRQEIEKEMPDKIEGTMTANLKYDIKEAFGVGQALYYLPEMTEEEWNENYQQYGFWKGKGYLRADSVSSNGAAVSVYLDGERKISGKVLQEGQLSELIYIPGFYCMAGLQLRLDGLVAPNTRAKINVDGDIFEVADGERFLDNKCQVLTLEDLGISKSVKISCDDDEKRRPFELKINPRIILEVDDKTNDYSIGDYIADDENNYFYVGAVNTKGNSGKLKDLRAYIVTYPKKDNPNKEGEKLSESEIKEASRAVKDISGVGQEIISRLWKGARYEKLEFDDSDSSLNILGKQISLVGFAGANDMPINEEFEDYFRNAKINYEKIINDFPGEKINDGLKTTYAQKGFVELIELAERTKQMQTLVELCEEYKLKYPEPEYISEVSDNCDNDLKIANTEIDSIDVSIDGRVKTISFEDVNEPSFTELGALVSVSGSYNDYSNLKLTQNYRISLSEDGNEYFEIVEIEEDYIKVSGKVKKNSRSNPSSFSEKIEINKIASLGDSVYEISLHDINIEKVAKVSVVPNIRFAETEANFSFNIGIEKRAIQLSPEKIKSKIDNLDKQIEKWSKISNTLDNTVKTLKTGCLAYGGYLTLKNFIANKDGKSIARQQVMRGDGGWYNYCIAEKEAGRTNSIDDCLYENSKKIDKEVELTADKIKTQNEDIKEIEKSTTTVLGRVIDDEEFMKDYPDAVRKDLLGVSGFENLGMTKEEIEGILTTSGWENNKFYKEDLRDIQLYSRILEDSSFDGTKARDVAERELKKKLSEIKKNSEEFVELQSAKAIAEENGIKDIGFSFREDDVSKKDAYDGGVVTADFVGNLRKGALVQGIIYNNMKYLAELEVVADNKYIIKNVFDIDGYSIDETIAKEIKSKYSYFQKYDSSSYKNKFLDYKVRYYETEPYKGYPAIVPFDLKDGWYAAVKETLPVFGGIRSYDESGRVASFWLCNVGKDGREQFFNDIGGDECQQIVYQGGRYVSNLPWLSQGESENLVNDAVNAIEQAQKQRLAKKNIQQVKISTKRGSYTIPVGNPAVDVPEVQCQDFMSPSDCHTLFNLCDPVICPSSRCNMGGNYYVDDVIRSGIIGGFTMCLSNWNGGKGVIMPVCLSGINAGVENLLSMSNAYRSCLQESLETGKTVGICDQIYSIYTCEFLWRQAAPFSGIIIPKILEAATGQWTKGGGEYMGIQSAWQNSENSIDYLKNYYGANSWRSFQQRSTQDVGTTVCKNFVSMVGPDTSGFIDALTEPDSPSQYNAWFDEIPFTTATVPPISQYKVFYHIYAGKDIGASYRVYLKSPTGGSLYQDNPTIMVAQGYIGIGEYATETKDLTASSGYQQLCVVVNSQEECGFSQVSTGIVQDYISDKYVEEQTTQTITQEKDCVSGTSSVYSFLTPNVQEGADAYLNPDLYNSGIVRICGTSNPGQGTDANVGTKKSRWVSVGYCGDKAVKCWLDTQSVKDIVKFEDIEEGILQDTTTDYIRAFEAEGNYLVEGMDEYDEAIDGFNWVIGNGVEKTPFNKENLIKAVDDINSLYEKVIMSDLKAELLSYKSRAFKRLASKVALDFKNARIVREEEEKIAKEQAAKEQAEEIVAEADFLFSQDIEKYKTKQLSQADEELIKFIECLDKRYYKEQKKHIVVTSITDNNLYRGGSPSSCNIYDSNEKYTDSDNCVHSKGSCHYYPNKKNEDILSRAVDIRTNGYSISSLTNSFDYCKDDLDKSAMLIPESTHIHISIKGCDSSDKGEVEETQDVAGKIGVDEDGIEDVTQSTIFTIKDGRWSKDNINLIFSESKWQWGVGVTSLAKSFWYDIEDSSSIEKADFHDSIKKLIVDLKQSNYQQGLESIINYITTNKGGLFANPKLSTEKVDMDDEEVFAFKQGSYLFNFRYASNNWELFEPSLKKWIKIEKDSEVFFDSTANSIANSLVGLNFNEGTRILFDVNLK